MTSLPPSPFFISSDLVSRSDVSAAAATSPPAPVAVAAAINSSFARPEKSGESTAASAWVSSSPQLRAPVEPAAVEVGCGQAPDVNSTPMHPPVSVNCDKAPAASLFSSADPGPCGFDFEAEIAILEAQWARDGIVMNATTFFIEAISSIPHSSSSRA